MADEIDQATAHADLMLSVSLRQRKHQATTRATGRCLNCNEPVVGERRWCCAECRDEWEKPE